MLIGLYRCWRGMLTRPYSWWHGRMMWHWYGKLMQTVECAGTWPPRGPIRGHHMAGQILPKGPYQLWNGRWVDQTPDLTSNNQRFWPTDHWWSLLRLTNNIYLKSYCCNNIGKGEVHRLDPVTSTHIIHNIVTAPNHICLVIAHNFIIFVIWIFHKPKKSLRPRVWTIDPLIYIQMTLPLHHMERIGKELL